MVHVEVGGSYGGSLRALELYLRHARRDGLAHDVLFYYPTPGAERLNGVARRVLTAFARAPQPRAAAAGRPKRALAGWCPEALREWSSLPRGAHRLPALLGALARGYDVVHVNNTFTYQPLTMVAARLARRPVLAHVRNPVRRGAYARGLMGLAGAVVTVNDGLRRELASWGGRPPVSTCYDAVALEPPDAAAAAALRARLLPDGGALVGSAGRLDEQKGYAHLVRAAALLAKSHPALRFAVAGDGPERDGLARLVSELGLAGRFELCGFRPDVSTFLSALDVFVSPSLWEGGGPLTVVEAMLLAKPVVATAVGAAPEFVEPDRTAVLVPPGDPPALAHAIVRAIEGGTALLDPGRVRAAAERFADPARNAEAFDQVLRGLLT